jgi:hypothetical protein
MASSFIVLDVFILLSFLIYSVQSGRPETTMLPSLSSGSCGYISLIYGRSTKWNNTSIPNGTNTAPLQQGWTPQPSGRGTIDIIWTSFTTIFLCCWTSLCLNVLPRYFRRGRRVYHKALFSCLSLIGPEFTFQLALGQWSSARRSVEEFRHSGYPNWSMSHAFLADMGGFILHAPDWVPFPLNAIQVHYLVTQRYISYSSVGIDMTEIEDKNKGDGVVRFITVLQMLWFSLNCLGRLIQHLSITTLELTTVGFIVCTLGTYFFWRHKPLDVGSAIILEPNITLADIIIRAGKDASPSSYKLTPLDFVSQEQPYTWRLYWTYWVNILRKLRIVLTAQRRPVDKIPDANWPAVSGGWRWNIILFLVQITYGSLSLCAWNLDFPSRIERLLWHISTCAIVVAIVIYWIADLYAWHILPAVKKYFVRRRLPDAETQDSDETAQPSCFGFPTKFNNAAARLRNNSPGHDPALNIPLIALVPVTAIGACYCFARAYILLEDILNLRALPPSAYDSVNWSSFLPHFL